MPCLGLNHLMGPAHGSCACVCVCTCNCRVTREKCVSKADLERWFQHDRQDFTRYGPCLYSPPFSALQMKYLHGHCISLSRYHFTWLGRWKKWAPTRKETFNFVLHSSPLIPGSALPWLAEPEAGAVGDVCTAVHICLCSQGLSLFM